MRKQLPLHGETRITYPFSLRRRYVDGYVIWLERYKLIETYCSYSDAWKCLSRHLDDRKNFINHKDEIKTLGGPY